MSCTSCSRLGPFGPAVCEFWLSPTGAPLSRVSTDCANAAGAMAACSTTAAVTSLWNFMGRLHSVVGKKTERIIGVRIARQQEGLNYGGHQIFRWVEFATFGAIGG